MSFPNVIYGGYGDEKVAQSTKIGNLPLGQLMILSDGRKFRHSRADSANALDPGKLCVQEANSAGHGDVAGSGMSIVTAVVGAGTITIKSKSAAILKDQYADGYMCIQDDPGEGLVYKIKGNNSAAVSANCAFTLGDDEVVHTAMSAASTTVGLRKNEFDRVLLQAAGTTRVGMVAGVPPISVSANFYFWCQRSGAAAMLVSGTAVVTGEPVVSDTATAGGITAIVAGSALTTLLETDKVGRAMLAASATEYALVHLELE